MSAPSVPLHGFIWALIPQTTHSSSPPSTNRYILQVFERKPRVLLVLSWIPLFTAAVVAGALREWQGMTVQVATAVAFLATCSTPEMPEEARENAFGRAGRFILVPCPGRRDDTVAYGVDFDRQIMLEPVRVSMEGVEAYRMVSELKMGRLGRETDDETTSEVPMGAYLDALPTEELGYMTGKLWLTLEDWKPNVTDPSKEWALMYGLVERMAYVAYRPGQCTAEERALSVQLNFLNCRTDCGRVGAFGHEEAIRRRAAWREEGQVLVGGPLWESARARGSNPVDKDVRSELLQRAQAGDCEAQDTIDAVGAILSFVKYIFGHRQDLVDLIMPHIPLYHCRIRGDFLTQGSIPVVCHGIFFSMQKSGLITENVLGHEWAATEGVLRWGGGGYALLYQEYAKNSAIGYVVQLAIIVVKAVLEE